MTDRLAPLLRHRLTALVTGSGWRRTVYARRAVAAVLASAALVLALAPPTPAARSPVLVAARDLAAGVTVGVGDVAVRRWPSEIVPAATLTDPAEASGRVLVGAARAGEALTDRRLAGAGPDAGPGAAAVAVRLADAAVAVLLLPGRRVDVVAAGERADAPSVLARDAVVIAVLAEDERGKGRLVLVALPRETATRVAAGSLAQPVAITLR